MLCCTTANPPFCHPLFRVVALLSVLLALAACKPGFGRSGNNDLSSLAVVDSNNSSRPLSPSFSSEELDYELTVSNVIASLRITPTAANEEASIKVNGSSVASGESVTVGLAVGTSTVAIEVTAENEFTKTYEIVVTRSATNATDASISSLTVNGAELTPSFSSETLVYTLKAHALAGAIRLTADYHEEATANLNGADPLTDGEAVEVPFNDVEQITLNLVAGDTTTTRAYQFNLSQDPIGDLTAEEQSANIMDLEDDFGRAVAIYGNTMVVGAPGEDGDGLGDDQTNNNSVASGAVYVFTRTDENAPWGEPQYLKAPDNRVQTNANYGWSVALYGGGDTDAEVLAVGAPGRTSTDTDNDPNGFLSGVVYLYTRNSEGNWDYDESLSASDTPPAGDQFGTAVSFSADAKTLLVGAPGDTSSQGAAYVFTEAAGTWSQQAKVTSNPVASGARFGESLQMNVSDEFIVGAPQADNSTGAAYLFRKNGASWGTGQAIRASNAGQGDQFGYSVAILHDRVLVGAPYEDNGNGGVFAVGESNSSTDSGAAYLFERNGSSWSQRTFYFKPAFATDADNDSRFGTSVALAVGTVAVGAPMEDSSSANGLIATVEGERNQQALNSGAVFLYTRSASDEDDSSGWAFLCMVKLESAANDEEYGAAIALAGSELVVGAPKANAENADGNIVQNAGKVQAIR